MLCTSPDMDSDVVIVDLCETHVELAFDSMRTCSVLEFRLGVVIKSVTVLFDLPMTCSVVCKIMKSYL